MATNRIYERGVELSLAATAPATPSSGDPVLFGEIPGVALTDEDDDGNTTIAFEGVFELSVDGQGPSAAAEITAGDIVYYDGGEINVDDTNGTRFGYALEGVASDATATIQVKVGY
jgi:predicted RecA/RadA family phage recombinase